MPHTSLSLLQKALFSGESPLGTVVAPQQANGPEMLFSDVYERAVVRLNNLGFVADVRTYRMGFGDDRQTLAVYVDRHDPRLEWTSAHVDAVPAVFEYRLADRRGFEFTLFSGSGIEALRRFLNCLTHPRQLEASPLEGPPRREWDPHCLEGEQYMEFAASLREFERISDLVEQQMLCAQLASSPVRREKVAANQHFIDTASISLTPQG